VAPGPLPAIVLLCVGIAAAQSQPPARDPSRAPREGTGVIRGRVVRADTGEPLRRVQVRVDEWSAKDQGGPVSTMTDAEGRYELTQLPAGSYQLKATRGGFVEVSYGQRRPFERGRPLELSEGAVLEKIDFALPPGGVVTGRVVDEVGEAVAQVSVSLARRRYVEGVRRLVPQAGGSTDDRGEFRIYGVPPGDYVMVAVFDPVDFGARDRTRYVPTYYPGTPVVGEAQRVTVSVGHETSGMTIPLARAATAVVRGVVRPSGQVSLGPFAFISAREIGGARVDGHVASAIVASDGAFSLTGLLPGTYLVETQSVSGTAAASKEVIVGGADIAGLTLVLSEGARARGRIVFDTGKPPQGLRPSQVLVTATLDREMGRVDMNGGPPVARDDWSFEVRGLRGRGVMVAGTFDGDWRMKRVRRDGVDVTDTPLDFSGDAGDTADIDDLEIELTDRLTVVSGTVSDDRAGVALDAAVVVFADDESRWGPSSRFIESARPDQYGRFTIRGLPPGKYTAIAVGYLEPGEEHDPELLQAWRPRGTSFTLSEGETHALDLKLSGS